MKTNLKQLLIIGASAFLLAGCAIRQPTQWEYKVVPNSKWRFEQGETQEDWQKDQEALMNSLGKDGWIFVSKDDADLYFKRPVK